MTTPSSFFERAWQAVCSKALAFWREDTSPRKRRTDSGEEALLSAEISAGRSKTVFFLFFLFAVSAWKMSSAMSDTVGESVPSFHAGTECAVGSPEEDFSATMEYLLDCGNACVTQCLCDDSVFSLDSFKLLSNVIGTVVRAIDYIQHAGIRCIVSSCRIVQHDSADYYVYMLERIIV